MPRLDVEKRRQRGRRAVPLAQWLTLLGLGLMAIKAGFELAKTILVLFQ